MILGMNYNIKFAKRWNDRLRRYIVAPLKRRKLKNKNFSLFANNCNGGFICHDLGVRFNTPTINMFFYKDHFFTFLEHLDQYLEDELVIHENPEHTPETDYPVCSLGGKKINGCEVLPKIELHFLHYKDFKHAKDSWDRRRARVNKENIFALFSFFDDTDELWLKRFDAIPLKNKIALVNRPFPQYKSAFYIPGYETSGLQQLGEYVNLLGKRKFDDFNYVKWFNDGK